MSDIRVGVDVGRGDEPLVFTVFDRSTNTVLYSGSDPDKVRPYQINQLVVDEQDLSYALKKGILPLTTKEEELREAKWRDYQAKEASQLSREIDFYNEKGIDVYTSDDYCGMSVGKYVFYFGYEETICPKHKTNTERCNDTDCELGEWAFTATVDNKEVLRVPQSQLHPKQYEEPFFHLLTGIAMFLKDSKK